MIGIIGAMDSETQGLKNLICDKKTEIISGIEFVCGKIDSKDVVCAKCNPGKVNSALCAQAMILKYKPDVIVNSGVAGSLTSNLSVYDVAIAKDCVQHDFDTSPLGSPVGMIDGLDKIYFECDEHAIETLKAACENEKYLLGTIASGDVFVSGQDARDKITRNFDAIACEMEGASIAHVCYVNKVKFGILRVISDGGDEVDFGTFVKETSKKSIEIMRKFVNLY